jgi:maleamate amidohydrolase
MLPHRVRLGFGRRPALLCIDLMRAYTQPGSPLWACGVVEALQSLPVLLDAARSTRTPVLHTRVAYQPPHFADGGTWIRKAPVLRALVPDSPLTTFDRRARPSRGELVITKHYSSAFAGTSLAATLAALGVDTLLLAGCTTSGCVRASAMDALQWGFRPIVVRECVGDRHREPHLANLRDMDADWGDVVSLRRACTFLASAQVR